MIFKTIYKSNENYETLKDVKESSVNASANANFLNSLNSNKFLKTHFSNTDDLNLKSKKNNRTGDYFSKPEKIFPAISSTLVNKSPRIFLEFHRFYEIIGKKIYFGSRSDVDDVHKISGPSHFGCIYIEI